jgi:hypothetical protein
MRPASTAAASITQINELLLSLFLSACSIVVPDVPVVPVPDGMLVSTGAVPVVAAGMFELTSPDVGGVIAVESVCAGADVEMKKTSRIRAKYLICVPPLSCSMDLVL